MPDIDDNHPLVLDCRIMIFPKKEKDVLRICSTDAPAPKEMLINLIGVSIEAFLKTKNDERKVYLYDSDKTNIIIK